MKSTFRRYAEISKVEEQEDGTLKVFGYASSEAQDSDGETISADAMKAALPDYLKFGAVREMHQPIAAGTAIEADVEKDGKTWFGAHVVDPIAVKKVQTKTYKGFSIGGKVTQRDELNKNLITGLKLVEISLVDRPANPDATFTMYKGDALDEIDVGTALKNASQEAVQPLAEILNKGEMSPQGMLAVAKEALAKAKATDEPAATAAGPAIAIGPSVVKVECPKGDALKKGISSLCNFANLLQSISWLASDAAYEAAYEGDGSPVPAQLRDWLKQGVSIFAAMSTEEIAELIASIKPVQVVTVTAADKTGDLEKAGAKFSKATKAALEKVHQGMKEACAHLDGLGYKEDDDMESAAKPDITKAADPDSALASAEPKPDTEVQKVEAVFKAELAKRDATIEALTKRLEAIEKQPAPGKAFLRAIGKADDVIADSDSKTAAEELPADATPEQRAHAAFVKVFRTGGTSLATR